jgi:hypothetical protein
MIPLLRAAIHALFWDANAARRWLKGGVAVLAVEGMKYADQVAALFHAPIIAKAIQGATLFAAFTVAVHDKRKRAKP